jgi:hypothetical protein
MYGSYQRHLMNAAADEAWRKKKAEREAAHEAHAAKHGTYCPETHVVGASWDSGWICPHCGYNPN